MTLPYITFQSVWVAKAATDTVALNSEFSKCATKVIEIKTAGFSGTLDIQGRLTGQSSYVNIPYRKIGQATTQASSVSQLSWTTDTTDSVQYVIEEPYAEVQLVMTRTAGSITLQAYGLEQAFLASRTAISHPLNITVQSATAFTVARAGTNYAFQVDTNTASSATGIKVTAAAAGGNVVLAAISSGANETLDIDAKGTGEIRLGIVSSGNIVLQQATKANHSIVIDTTGQANAFAVGQNGATNAAFHVDDSAASQATGVKVTGAAAGSRVTLAAISSGTNEGIDIDAKGSGTIRLGNTSTGAIDIQRAVTIAGANTLTFGGDAALSRGAANRLDLASGDNFRILSGNLVIGNATSVGIRLGQNLETNNSGQSGGIALNTWDASSGAPIIDLNKSKSSTVGTHTIVANGDVLGYVVYRGSDGVGFIDSALIRAEVDGTPGVNDMPGRLIFATTADGAASATERLRIDSAGDITIADGGDFILNATTGTKIGTATTQKLGFYNATPIVQGAAVADASGGATIDAEARTAINALLARIRSLGLIAT